MYRIYFIGYWGVRCNLVDIDVAPGEVGPAGVEPEPPEGGARQGHQAAGHIQEFHYDFGGSSQGEHLVD